VFEVNPDVTGGGEQAGKPTSRNDDPSRYARPRYNGRMVRLTTIPLMRSMGCVLA
jgi:hypothetical protein